MTLELDHVLCMVDDLDAAALELQRAGWAVDSGTVHVGEGTRNRRVLWPLQHLELLTVVDDREAQASPLRLDRRADWRSTKASPFGFGLRGTLPERWRRDFWPFLDGETKIWVSRDNERAPQRPLLFVVEVAEDDLELRRPRTSHADLLRDWDGAALCELRITGPEAAALPAYEGPPITQSAGEHHLELVTEPTRAPLRISPILAIR